MARDWDTDTMENNGTTSDQGARSSIGVDRKQPPLEEALVSLDTAISKLDKVVLSLLVRLAPVSNTMHDSPEPKTEHPEPPNSAVVNTLKEYQRRVIIVMTRVAIATNELEL